MAVQITFQGPSFGSTGDLGTLDQAYEWKFEVAGFDLDYGMLTVYMDYETGDNNVLAEPYKYVNENGDDCGEIGWKIKPDDALMNSLSDEQRAEVERATGWEFGRVIVTAGGFAVDKGE
jgi:hypothetical protein